VRALLPFLVALSGIVGCGGSTSSESQGNGGTVAAGGSVSAGGNVSSGGSGGGTCEKLCNGECVPLDDPATGCATDSCEACHLPHATATCDASGVCAIASCDPGWVDCDVGDFLQATTGCETNLAFDPSNCGGCGIACTAEPGSEATCTNGTCGGVGCEEPLNTTQNCGKCANECSAHHATPSCLPAPGAGYVCTLTCDDGFSDCDALVANGCERASASCE
jgi:hypothetical protein